MKRVLVVTQHFWPENFRISDIVEGFVQDGFAVDVLCGLPNYPKGEWFEGYSKNGPLREEYKGAQLFRVKEVPRRGNTSARIFLNYVSYPITAWRGLKKLKSREYDAVFCYQTSPVLMIWPAYRLAKKRHIPLTTYVLDLWPDNLYSVLPIKNKLLRGIAGGVSNWLYRKNDKLITMSDLLGAELRRSVKDERPIAIIPQYCEDFYAEDIEDTALREKYAGHFTILFAGNISPAQDLENLVLAMKRVYAAGQTHIRCLLVGDGMSREALQGYIKEHGMEQAFVFCGSHPATDMPKWTGIADALFAGLSKSANLGLTVPAKITSYLAAGRPLLVAADGEAARVSRESGAALVSPAGDADALAKNILTLAGLSPDERKAMGQKGRAAYREGYSRAKLLRQLEDFII